MVASSLAARDKAWKLVKRTNARPWDSIDGIANLGDGRRFEIVSLGLRHSSKEMQIDLFAIIEWAAELESRPFGKAEALANVLEAVPAADG